MLRALIHNMGRTGMYHLQYLPTLHPLFHPQLQAYLYTTLNRHHTPIIYQTPKTHHPHNHRVTLDWLDSHLLFTFNISDWPASLKHTHTHPSQFSLPVLYMHCMQS